MQKVFEFEFSVFNKKDWKRYNYKIISNSIDEIKKIVLEKISFIENHALKEQEWDKMKEKIKKTNLKLPITITTKK